MGDVVAQLSQDAAAFPPLSFADQFLERLAARFRAED
jgi:hypothetical protein